MSEVELYPGHVSRLGLGTIPAADLASFSGLELLRRMVEGHYPAPPMAGLMNFGLVEAEAGRAVMRRLAAWPAIIPDEVTVLEGRELFEQGCGESGLEESVDGKPGKRMRLPECIGELSRARGQLG